MDIDPSDLLERLLTGEHLSEPDAAELMRVLTDDTLAPAQAGALLAELSTSGEAR